MCTSVLSYICNLLLIVKLIGKNHFHNHDYENFTRSSRRNGTLQRRAALECALHFRFRPTLHATATPQTNVTDKLCHASQSPAFWGPD